MSARTVLSVPRLLAPGGRWTGPASVELAGGRIVRVGDPRGGLALEGGTLTAGMLDLHNNGAFGADFATAEGPAWHATLAKLAARGVTAVQPTVITAPLPDILAALGRMACADDESANQPVARILGAHLEGPFLSPARRGAHRADWLLDPTPEVLDALLGDPAVRRMLRTVTLAPERPHGLAAIRRLVREGIVVALGHSDASAAEALAAVEAGATMVTHVFNAMRPMGHRDPALPGVALTDARLWCCLIVDGQHVDPVACRLAFQAAGPRLVAVSDSILVAGLPPGTELAFGGMPVRVDDTGLGRRLDGTISGAGIVLDEGVRRMVAAGVDPAQVLRAVTEAPADAIGRADLGRIAPGARADLVWWDEDWMPRRVWIDGVEVTGAMPETLRIIPESGLDSLATEGVRAGLDDLDERPVQDIVHLLLSAERQAQTALARAEPQLAAAVAAVVARMRQGGRLFYLGAGTPGRLAMLDAAELAPTYSAPPGLVIPLLAGGPTAMVQAAEGAEDDGQAAAAALDAHDLQPDDAVVGIAASGRTPFVVEGLRHARARGALTVAVVNNPRSPAADMAELRVEILTGAEVVAGSTRMTAGTTQKIALNTLSTAVMVALGKTYGARMVDVRATNEKLRRRALRMVQDITGEDEVRSAAALAEADGRVKPAVVALLAGVGIPEAVRRLDRVDGFVRRAIGAAPEEG